MVDKAQEDELMKQYMDTCKEQIEKLAKDPDLLSQTLKPFMQMSRNIMASGMLEGNILPSSTDIDGMDINKMVVRIQQMISYIKGNYKVLMKEDASQIQELDDSSRRLRGLIRKLVEKIKAQ